MRLNKITLAIALCLNFSQAVSADGAPVTEKGAALAVKPVIEHITGIWVPLVKVADNTPVVVTEIVKPVNQWKVSAGSGIHETLNKWADKAGWQLSWEIVPDLALTSEATFSGDFNEAVKELITSINASSSMLIHAKFFDGNNVLRIYKEI